MKADDFIPIINDAKNDTNSPRNSLVEIFNVVLPSDLGVMFFFLGFCMDKIIAGGIRMCCVVCLTSQEMKLFGFKL